MLDRLGYSLLLLLLFPYTLLHLLWRARRQPAYLQHVGERFGFYRIAAGRPLIWVHAVSVGETRAAVPLVQQLMERYPGHQILLTHMTPTGREASEELFGDAVLRCYLPYDYGFAVRRFLRHFGPALGVLVETELWFNLISRCAAQGIPLVLVNARMSEKSADKYARFPALTRLCLQRLTAVAAQTDADAARLAALGAATPQVTGNLKFDVPPPKQALQQGAQLRDLLGKDRRVLLAASTRDGEEALLLDALAKVSCPPALLMVIVPRHPQRFGDVADLLQNRAVSFQCRSAGQPIAPETRVVLGDSMGEMFGYYAAADVAFIGGSLLPYGGQNLIEACAVGKPVLLGPHTYNFTEAARLAVESGAALRVEDAEDLLRCALELLQDPAATASMSRAALAFSQQHRGATGRAMALVEPYLMQTGRP
jgi:3-deoxy-D-manno-octulosonic-acid transferase